MREPEGRLTPAQLEILEAVWDGDPGGVTTAEIWEVLRERRPLARTTVLTQVRRLEKRGWLARRRSGRRCAFVATRPRGEAAGALAGELVDEFFGGSASHFVMSLLGARKIQPAELRRLRRLLDQASQGKKP